MPCQRCVAVAVGLGAGRTSCMPTRAMTLRVAALICASLALRDVLPGAASSAMTGSGVIAGWLSAHTPGWQPSASCVLASNAGSIFTSRCFLWLAASSAFAISHRFVSRSYTVPVGQGKARSIESAEAAALAVLRANDFPPALGAKVSFLRESWALAGYPNALRPTGAALLAMRAWELALQAASQAHGAPVSLHLEMGVLQATATPVY